LYLTKHLNSHMLLCPQRVQILAPLCRSFSQQTGFSDLFQVLKVH